MPPSRKTSTSKPPPVLGICGHSGSGKTTLIVRLLPRLRRAGLRVGVVKHDAHGLDVDRPGKDSDRLFRAGADVLIHGPREGLIRFRARRLSLEEAVARLGTSYDLVLVEGHKSSSVPKVWLLGEGETAPPPRTRRVLAVLGRDADRLGEAMRVLERLRRASRFVARDPASSKSQPPSPT